MKEYFKQRMSILKALKEYFKNERFRIESGKVTFQCRFLQSDAYKENIQANGIVFADFWTSSVPDPWKQYLGSTVYNLALGRSGPSYKVVRFPNKSENDGDDYSMFDKAYTVAEIPAGWSLAPSYMDSFDKHSFKITGIKIIFKFSTCADIDSEHPGAVRNVTVHNVL
ncbi:hypothetical protein FQA39_LY03408 [Lamprigera yunnana]|nr:hypothetical protein FQA39_LY03408 [Lamprigera yunnana]